MISSHLISSPPFSAGDFNINAKTHRDDSINETEEYKLLVNELNTTGRNFNRHMEVVDLLKLHNNGRHLTTYADICPTTKKALETVLTHRADLCTQECIDHVFFMDTKWNRMQDQKQTVPRLSPRENSSRVEEFFEADKTMPVTQLSDHYGVNTVFEFHI